MAKATKKIIFATDLAEYSKPILAYAIQYAAATNSALEVLHVVAPQGEALDLKVMVVSATQQEVVAARKQLKEYVEMVRSMIPKNSNPFPELTEEVIVGTPFRVIVDRAEKEEIAMILVGTRGSNRSRLDIWLGSVSATLVESASCPVMVIPGELVFNNISVVTYATDVQESDPFEIWRAIQMLSPFLPVIHVVHIDVRKTQDEAAIEKMAEMETFFSGHSPGMQIQFHQLHGKNLVDQLNEFSFLYDSDLLIMYQPHHSFWNKLFHRSQTNKMALSTNGPLLILKEKD